jgi:hypothetical protein
MDLWLLITYIARIIVSMASGAVLLTSWARGGKRYLSDFPFLMAIVFFTLAVGKMVDLYIAGTFGRSVESVIFFSWLRARYLIIAINIAEMLIVIMIIWFKSRTRLQLAILAGYGAAWALLLVTDQTYDAFTLSNSIMLTPVIIAMIGTFLFIQHQKRLTNKLNAKLIAIGTIVYAISSLLQPTFATIGGGEWGLLPLNEVIDLVGWLLIFAGFFIPIRLSQQAAKHQHILSTNSTIR